MISLKTSWDVPAFARFTIAYFIVFCMVIAFIFPSKPSQWTNSVMSARLMRMFPEQYERVEKDGHLHEVGSVFSSTPPAAFSPSRRTTGNSNHGGRRHKDIPMDKKVPRNSSGHALNDTKLVLFWTKLFNLSDFGVGFGSRPFKGCPVSNCVASDNKVQLLDASAVMFHGRSINMADLPQQRLTSQRYVFCLMESPEHTFLPYHRLKGFFNMTMTYRRDSDIVRPYFQTVKKSGIDSSLVFLPATADLKSSHREDLPGDGDKVRLKWEKTYTTVQGSERSRDESSASSMSEQVPSGLDQNLLHVNHTARRRSVLWLVTHCTTPSGREHFAIRLSRHIMVHTYGGCGHTCPDKSAEGNPHSCLADIAAKYHFYLALENSMCRDYITEKFSTALVHNLVPVVLGPPKEDYEAIAPPGSFIHADDFRDEAELAEYLKFLMANLTAYQEFFKWRDYYTVVENGQFKGMKSSWCQLCAALHEDQVQQRTYDLGHWWRTQASCRRLPREKLSFVNSYIRLISSGHLGNG